MIKKKKRHINADLLETLGVASSKEEYVYDPNKLSEKIGDFFEHVIAGLLIGFLMGFGFGFFWLILQA